MKLKEFLFKKKKIIGIIIVAIILLIGGIILNNSKTNVEANTNKLTNNTIKVSIEGNVKYPNEYDVYPYTKVKDLIEIAGGLTSNGDTSLLNLEKVLEAGEVVYVSSISTSSKKININTASIDVLKKDLKLTSTQANNLVMYRMANGKFNNVYDLLKVDGFKSSTILEIINEITLS